MVDHGNGGGPRRTPAGGASINDIIFTLVEKFSVNFCAGQGQKRQPVKSLRPDQRLPVPKKIRLGSDCTGGFASEKLACEYLGLPTDHVFGSEMDIHTRALCAAMDAMPHSYYHDMTTREVKTTPEVDLYVAGPPCQPFSSQGLNHGVKDLQ